MCPSWLPSEHVILHLISVQNFPFKVLKGGKPESAYQMVPSGGSRQMMGAGGLRAFVGLLRRRRTGKKRGIQQRGNVNQTMSWVHLCGQYGNYRVHTEKADRGKRQRYSKCWVAVLYITATSPSYSTGHERSLPDKCTDVQCPCKGSRQPRQGQVGHHKLVSPTQGLQRAHKRYFTAATIGFLLGSYNSPFSLKYIIETT